jgi:hypothetical protein
MKDPLELSERYGTSAGFAARVARVIIDGQIFSPDTSCLLMFLTRCILRGTPKNEPLIAALKTKLPGRGAFTGCMWPSTESLRSRVQCRQVEKRNLLTLSVAWRWLVFNPGVQSKVSILLLSPPSSLDRFSFAVVFPKGEISAIAAGSSYVGTP